MVLFIVKNLIYKIPYLPYEISCSQLNMKKTKVIATTGPASASYEVLKGLADAGANIIRFNFSHAKFDEAKAKFDIIRQNNLPLGILLDTKGPEIRTGEVRGEYPVKLGDKITFTTDAGIYEDTGKVSVNYKEFIKDVHVGTILTIDSGLIFAKVLEVSGSDVITEVIKGGGKITTKRHMNFTTGEDTSQPTLGEKDWKDIDFGIQEKVDFIALSFTRSAKDVIELRNYCQERGHVPSIVAKIESQLGVDNLEEIVEASDGIMVARGDMAVEIPYYQVPQVQEQCIELCNYYAKPVIIATQMLQSMCDAVRPTRAEVNDVAIAAMHGADVTMTSDETAKGKYPVDSIQVMSEIVGYNEEAGSIENDTDSVEEIGFAVARGAVAGLAESGGVDGIVLISNSIDLARHISKTRTPYPIYAFANNLLSVNKMRMFYGVQPNLIDFKELNNNDACEDSVRKALTIVKSIDNACKRVLLLFDFTVNETNTPVIMIREVL